MAEYPRSDAKPLGRADGGKEDQNDKDAKDSGESIDCPECGKHLETLKDRQKHAVEHYGERPLSRYPSDKTARERKSALLGVDEREV